MSLTTTTTSHLPLLERAARVGEEIAQHAERHDRDATFVVEAYDALRREGLLAAAVPVELGGAGASIAEVTAMQQELGRHCGSTALASAMHQHVTAFTAWRHRRGLPGAEATLRRVAEDGIVLVSTGGADFTHPRGQAVRVDGGYRVSGTKAFASQGPVGTAMSTMFPFEDPERGTRVLNMSVPLSEPGVRLVDNWDTLGMRGTGSGDIVVDDVFVPDERVLADRPHGTIDPPLQVILSIAMPIISGAYLGIARSAVDAATIAAAGSQDPITQRQIGLMRHRVQVAQWALDGALEVIAEVPDPSEERMMAALTAKREVALAAVEVCDLAMEVAGGSAFRKGSVIERAYRDVRAASFHPLTPEQTLRRSGQLAVGVPTDL